MHPKLAWLIAVLLTLTIAACGSGGSGSGDSPAELQCPNGPGCDPDDSSNGPRGACGGIAGIACPDGQVCVDVDDNCDPEVGADCPGQCSAVAPPEPECSSDSDCSTPPCSECPDGQRFCPEPSCVDGLCFAPVLDCPMPPPPVCGGFGGAGCAEGFDCIDDPNDDCGAGPAADCPGICVPSSAEGCSSDAECPQLRAACSVCRDGSSSCPRSYCQNGQCNIEMGACPEPSFCGGIAGFGCPEGQICIDAPNANCDPATGADCGGICVPDFRPTHCGGIAAIVCPEGEECVDDPNDQCDPGDGGADCGGVCQPALERCGSDAECPAIRIPCSVCPDGSEVCASSSCVEGRCLVAYPSCPAPVGCEQDPTQCKPGYHCLALADSCDATTGNWCRPSICVPDDSERRCGGFAGDVCAPGWRCTDEPMDECDPNQGGADCLGVCVPDEVSECRSDEECPHILAPCTVCADGTHACPKSFCRDGQCGVSIDACEGPGFCGGIAGFPCPRGLECIDDPMDDCDPAQGGADCGGICVPEEKPAQCDDDSDCFSILAPCQMCADGSAACPRSYCSNGECRAELLICGAES